MLNKPKLPNPQKRTLRCRFKGVNSQMLKSFPSSSCLLTISVGQQVHESDNFLATMALIHQSFQSCIVAVHDILQRFSIAICDEKKPEQLYDKAVQLGDEWILRNKKAFKNSTDKIIRWKDWLSHPNFMHYKRKVCNELDVNASYLHAFEKTIDEYIERCITRHSNNPFFNESEARRYCFDYLIEECAAMCLWPTTECKFELYSNSHNQAMEMTRAIFITPFHPGKVQPIVLAFNHRPDLKPQQFSTKKATIAA